MVMHAEPAKQFTHQCQLDLEAQITLRLRALEHHSVDMAAECGQLREYVLEVGGYVRGMCC
jgi:hypothetical protein